MYLKIVSIKSIQMCKQNSQWWLCDKNSFWAWIWCDCISAPHQELVLNSELQWGRVHWRPLEKDLPPGPRTHILKASQHSGINFIFYLTCNYLDGSQRRVFLWWLESVWDTLILQNTKGIHHCYFVTRLIFQLLKSCKKVLYSTWQMWSRPVDRGWSEGRRHQPCRVRPSSTRAFSEPGLVVFHTHPSTRFVISLARVKSWPERSEEQINGRLCFPPSARLLWIWTCVVSKKERPWLTSGAEISNHGHKHRVEI